LYVAEPGSGSPALSESGERVLSSLTPDAAALRRLEDFIERHVGKDRKVIPAVRVGQPEQEILRFAEDEGVDLIVMATHGWTGLQHLLLGSVAEKIVRHARVPVLTVKPKPVQDELLKSEDIAAQLHLT
jgi:nucleotide-binding universal stress UspA family protein